VAGNRITVVDDGPSTRLLLRLIFEDSGYEVTEAQNGIAALDPSCGKQRNRRRGNSPSN